MVSSIPLQKKEAVHVPYITISVPFLLTMTVALLTGSWNCPNPTRHTSVNPLSINKTTRHGQHSHLIPGLLSSLRISYHQRLGRNNLHDVLKDKPSHARPPSMSEGQIRLTCRRQRALILGCLGLMFFVERNRGWEG